MKMISARRTLQVLFREICCMGMMMMSVAGAFSALTCLPPEKEAAHPTVVAIMKMRTKKMHMAQV